MISRRNFIQSGVFAAVGFYTLGLSDKVFGQTAIGESYLLSSEALGDPLLTFTNEHFQPFVNTRFRIRNRTLRKKSVLRLVQVKQLDKKANRGRVQGECYSLLFQNENGVQLEPAIYEFSHNGLDNFSLFISSVTQEENLYEGVINHLKEI